MALKKITPEERAGKGVTGLGNVPGLSTADMQGRFDSLANLSIDAWNTNVDALDAEFAQRPTNQSMRTAIDEKVVALGAGDMAQAVYDPTHKNKDVFSYTDAAIGKVAACNFTATLSPTGWSATAPYTQTVAVTGMVDTMEPICDIVLTGTAADAAALEAYACVSRIASGVNSITATCLEDKPGAAINLKFKVVR